MSRRSPNKPKGAENVAKRPASYPDEGDVEESNRDDIFALEVGGVVDPVADLGVWWGCGGGVVAWWRGVVW